MRVGRAFSDRPSSWSIILAAFRRTSAPHCRRESLRRHRRLHSPVARRDPRPEGRRRELEERTPALSPRDSAPAISAHESPRPRSGAPTHMACNSQHRPHVMPEMPATIWRSSSRTKVPNGRSSPTLAASIAAAVTRSSTSARSPRIVPSDASTSTCLAASKRAHTLGASCRRGSRGKVRGHSPVWMESDRQMVARPSIRKRAGSPKPFHPVGTM